VQPILHLSIPVRDLGEARQFYVDTLGSTAARAREGYQDVWFYGMQLTLQCRPEEVAAPRPDSVRHFGVTLEREEFDAITSRLAAQGVPWVSPISTDHQGTPIEQTKTKIADPSGNVIELKTYRDVSAALEISRSSYPGSIGHGT
jgi:uncharacterized protein